MEAPKGLRLLVFERILEGASESAEDDKGYDYPHALHYSLDDLFDGSSCVVGL